jgi:hypothetical protein
MATIWKVTELKTQRFVYVESQSKTGAKIFVSSMSRDPMAGPYAIEQASNEEALEAYRANKVLVAEFLTADEAFRKEMREVREKNLRKKKGSKK